MTRRARWQALSPDVRAMLAIAALAMLTWLPRVGGPIDLRWDGAVHYILGTSLAEGRGYRLLNEPGAIAAVQYPPLLPAIVAVHQRALGTSDPTVVGPWLRVTAFVAFVAFAIVTLRFLRTVMPVFPAWLGAATVVLGMESWFLSDALYPEIAFSIATVLFLDFARRQSSPRRQAAAYACAVAAYALRTAGIVAFGAWVLDSLATRRWREALVRSLLALLPVLAWQGYVWSIERSSAYQQPAYTYQRAPYLFYNVSYARNIVLRDPFTPEKGDVRIVRRIARNLTDIPVSLGESLVAPRAYVEMGLHGLLGDGRIVRPAIVWSLFVALSIAGAVFTVGGAMVLGLRGDVVVPAYLFAYLAALAVTPFPDQYLRYLMPLTPVLALTALVFLDVVARRRVLVAYFTGVLAIQTLVITSVFVRQHQPVSYVDAHGQRVSQRLFFYDAASREFDEAIGFLQDQVAADAVVAAGTPHWIFLRTGLTSVMTPFEADPAREQALLDSVPVDYLVVGHDVIASERYTVPMLERYAARWTPVFRTAGGRWQVYKRTAADEAGRGSPLAPRAPRS